MLIESTYNQQNRLKNYIIGFSIITLLAILQTVILQDRLPFSSHGNFRWDSKRYSDWAIRFPNIFDQAMNSYDIQRIFPSMVVHYIMVLFGMDFTNKMHILYGFDIYNYLIIMIMGWLYFEIAREFKFNRETTWLGFTAVFLCYATAKFSYYYANLTDTTAIFIGLLLFYAYIKNNSWLMLLAWIIGAFTWPLTLYAVGCFFIFPRGMQLVQAPNTKTGPIIGGLAVLVVMFILRDTTMQLLMHRNYVVTIPNGMPDIKLNSFGYFTALACTVFYTYMVFSELFKNVSLSNFSVFTRKNLIIRAVIFIAVAFAISFIQKQLYFTATTLDVSVEGTLNQTLLTSITSPFIFMVAGIIFFGPILLLGIIYFKDTIKGLKDLGIGYFALISLTMFFFLNSQSRCVDELIMPLTIGIVYALRNQSISNIKMWLFIAASFVFSKIWLYMAPHVAYYYVSMGPWMEPKYYYLQLVVCIGALVTMYWGFRKMGAATAPKQEAL